MKMKMVGGWNNERCEEMKEGGWGGEGWLEDNGNDGRLDIPTPNIQPNIFQSTNSHFTPDEFT